MVDHLAKSAEVQAAHVAVPHDVEPRFADQLLRRKARCLDLGQRAFGRIGAQASAARAV
ncbi:hypothetical protein [Lentzea sp. NPDC004782]|uniref:hypothetical protein n=1 Tax=Lentzea sp. NPDC004782 TaxID=3154458 RepID=UPI0033BF3A4B